MQDRYGEDKGRKGFLCRQAQSTSDLSPAPQTHGSKALQKTKPKPAKRKSVGQMIAEG
jgi:hypothetical protein